uniref:Uncharacterized protein n=1 Tax=Oryza sativa subsp. japonica TaxID=39947 RepID=Q94H24_ORYSJ|nr:hypothetical protein [Oryza sativa Japonica Group]
MEVKKPVGGRRRQLALKTMTPISGDGDIASREEDSISWRHMRRPAKTPVGGDEGKPVGEDVDAQQRRYNRPAVQAKTLVGGDEGKPVVEDVDAQQRWHNRLAVQAVTPVDGGEGKPAVKM